MHQVVPITVLGAEQLNAELSRLKTQERPRIIAAISEARAHGDLKENAEYHAAREEQGFIEGRIQEIEGRLANCQIIDISKMPNDGKVIFGATVELLNLDSQQKVVYQIVGVDEADLKTHKISVASPLARALVGKYADDVVDVQTPNGLVSYTIVTVRY